ncbi:hypothetical protein [Acinetobacter guerrae]|uniref:hypothetical protein n=1 Tax=Acinetobacter guerrae TaxID=1843371 RepID=UPI001F4FE89C|nr:hypothetical protein [Acinetobacter guerrae]
MNMTNLTEQQNEDNQEFLIGDAVVLTSGCKNFISNDLFEIQAKSTDALWTIKSSNHVLLVTNIEIRTATVAELNAKRRLTDAEMALGEVS